MPLILSIVGFSNSGKTTLLEKMIPLLKAKGYSVGVIKHTGHDFSLDQPGKDSYRFIQSGADEVALVGSGQIGLRGKIDESDPLILDRIEQTFFPKQDILLTEGFKKVGKPKIAVLCQGKEEELLQEIEGALIATVGENPVRSDVPHFRLNDPEGLVNNLVDRFLKDREKPSIRVSLDGKTIPLNRFVQEMIRSSILGLLSPLKGFKESQTIEVKMTFEEKGHSR
jgi:molybdopterin-guanine dinucleotide biosynthesis protein MobB